MNEICCDQSLNHCSGYLAANQGGLGSKRRIILAAKDFYESAMDHPSHQDSEGVWISLEHRLWSQAGVLERRDFASVPEHVPGTFLAASSSI